MLNIYFRISVVFICLCCISGCVTLRRYPAIEKKVFSWQIPRNQTDTIKDVILSEGYSRVGKENKPYEGAITTLYEKAISANAFSSRIRILISFKETVPNDNFYKNFGITISNLDRGDIPEIDAEVNRIERILYEKLLEVAGKENVIRGKR